MHHALYSDILVEPDNQADLVLVVYLQHLTQHVLPSVIVCFRVAVERRVGVDRPKSGIPDGALVLEHGISVAEKLDFEALILFRDPRVPFPPRKARYLILVTHSHATLDGSHSPSNRAIRTHNHGVPHRNLPLHCESVAIKPKGVVRIGLSNRRFDSLVEGWKSDMFWVTGLVGWIIAGNPSVVLGLLSNFLPQLYRPILVILVVPESGIVGWVVVMPGTILDSGSRVHVRYRVKLVFATHINCFFGSGMICIGSWFLTRSITLSRCMNSAFFKTRGFMSSSKCR